MWSISEISDFNYACNLRESLLIEILEFCWKTVDCLEYGQTSYLKDKTLFNYKMHVYLKCNMLLKWF